MSGDCRLEIEEEELLSCYLPTPGYHLCDRRNQHHPWSSHFSVFMVWRQVCPADGITGKNVKVYGTLLSKHGYYPLDNCRLFQPRSPATDETASQLSIDLWGQFNRTVIVPNDNYISLTKKVWSSDSFISVNTVMLYYISCIMRYLLRSERGEANCAWGLITCYPIE